MILIKVCGKGAVTSFTLGLIDLVFEPITQTVIFHDTIIDVWEDFKEHFSEADRIQIVNLRSTINNLKQVSRSILLYQ